MGSSARKPYLRLRKSLVDFFRAPAVFLKNINQRFSEFEKPYLEGEYQPMHLDWPGWNWGGPWGGPKLPPPGAFGKIPRVFTVGCVVHCWHFGDCEEWVECSVLHWGGDLGKQGSVEITGDIIDQQEPWAGMVDFRFKVNPGIANPQAVVTYTDPTGQVCVENVTISCEACDSAAVIGYTTLGMQANETQMLEAQVGGSLDDGTAYTWEITAGEGSLSTTEGNSTIYTAPATNVNCADNPTIALSCEDVVLDSITIAVNIVTGPELAYFSHCCQDASWRVAGATKCDADPVACGGNCDYGCCTTSYFPCIGDLPRCCMITVEACDDEVFPYDMRSAAQKTAGCCPEAFI